MCHHCLKVNEAKHIYGMSNLCAEGRRIRQDRRSALDADRHHKANSIGTPAPLSSSCRHPPRSSPIGLGCTSRTRRPPILFENSMVANMCHTQALAYKVIVASSVSGEHWLNSLHSHVTRTPSSHPFTLGTFTGGSGPTKAATLSHHEVE
jgi:hypothetical protein